jgi:hypothetical protein
MSVDAGELGPKNSNIDFDSNIPGNGLENELYLTENLSQK